MLGFASYDQTETRVEVASHIFDGIVADPGTEFDDLT
jgi:hypothetical protein